MSEQFTVLSMNTNFIQVSVGICYVVGWLIENQAEQIIRINFVSCQTPPARLRPQLCIVNQTGLFQSFVRLVQLLVLAPFVFRYV